MKGHDAGGACLRSHTEGKGCSEVEPTAQGDPLEGVRVEGSLPG